MQVPACAACLEEPTGMSRLGPPARSRVLVIVFALLAACRPAGTVAPSPSPSASVASATGGATTSATWNGSVVIVGRIVTMDDPPVAEALLIRDGIVAAIGTRDAVLASAGDQVPVVDIGSGVAYPGFIDAHAHWIGDRDRYDVDSPAEAMQAALARGWTSISEQWVNPERLDELNRLTEADELPMRVDAYLALNFGADFLGDWYSSRTPGDIGDHLRVRGLKIHLDDGSGDEINWQPADLIATIGRADDAGWQVSVHAMSTEAIALVLDGFEAAIGPSGPNPLHHRVEHAMQVTDSQLARLVAMDLAVVTQTDGVNDWLSYDEVLPRVDRSTADEALDAIARWRDFVDAGLHFASATDAPWTFTDAGMTDDAGRPVDLIAAAMDGRRRILPPTPAWLLDQPLTAEEGLRAVTIDAAWALGDETRRGHLATGTLGDVTVLSGDVTGATPDELRAMSVLATIVGGVPAWCGDAAVCERRLNR
jgi:predicted amidohydrolase YtcJ